jgi:hypothetical protein
MRDIEEIKIRLSKADDDKRDFLFAHLFCEIILETKREEAKNSEYIEALIFTAYLIYVMKSKSDKESNDKLLQNLLSSFWSYSFELDDYIELPNVLDFIMKRFDIIKNEWRELNSNADYLTPLLIYNLYINPLNEENKSSNEVMEEIEFDELLKYCVQFRLKLNHLLQALNSLNQ